MILLCHILLKSGLVSTLRKFCNNRSYQGFAAPYLPTQQIVLLSNTSHPAYLARTSPEMSRKGGPFFLEVAPLCTSTLRWHPCKRRTPQNPPEDVLPASGVLSHSIFDRRNANFHNPCVACNIRE